MTEQRCEVAVVGGGIVGLAFAAEAARRGHSVILFERSPLARGASIRNFGMIWPIGQPFGEARERAMRSRARWLDVCEKAGIWVAECGSLHVVYEDDENALLHEFVDHAAKHHVSCEYLDASTTVQRFPAVNPNGLRGALWSPSELAVDPPQALSRLSKYLVEQLGVTLKYDTAIVGIDMPRITTASGDVWHAGRVFVCGGTDFETLFPATYREIGLRRCKLQMMATRPQSPGWKLGPHIAGGLTLGHYKSFEICSSLPALKQRIQSSHPEYVRLGIHVMASQNAAGEVIIGDSHQYDDAITPFDSPHIDELILAYLKQMIRVPDWTLSRRWHGEYAKHPTQPIVFAEPQPGCVIVSSPGGAGMTLAFGYAEDWWNAESVLTRKAS